MPQAWSTYVFFGFCEDGEWGRNRNKNWVHGVQVQEKKKRSKWILAKPRAPVAKLPFFFLFLHGPLPDGPQIQPGPSGPNLVHGGPFILFHFDFPFLFAKI